ncbi:MAG: hypothetical protein AMJ42_06530 [Deltaproteobacteria bacterium DG_8]|nr:MAG: hypothetical protein AMJ42_06530 [Deltaproteobacteria bacterium DG_8]
MKVGERIKFSFANGEKEGVIEKIFPKKVYLRVNFPNHPNKLIIRRIADLEADSSSKKKKKKGKKK